MKSSKPLIITDRRAEIVEALRKNWLSYRIVSHDWKEKLDRQDLIKVILFVDNYGMSENRIWDKLVMLPSILNPYGTIEVMRIKSAATTIVATDRVRIVREALKHTKCKVVSLHEALEGFPATDAYFLLFDDYVDPAREQYLEYNTARITQCLVEPGTPTLTMRLGSVPKTCS